MENEAGSSQTQFNQTPPSEMQPYQTFDKLWASFGGDFGLLPDLALDAVSARYRQGEIACVPRIVELVCTGEPSVAESAAALEIVEVGSLSGEQRRHVEAALDRWWLLRLMLPSVDRAEDAAGIRHVNTKTVAQTLGILAGYKTPLSRWLHIWLENFDGPAARHFVDVVLGSDEAPAEAWAGKEDEWIQFRTWCRLEPTVMGFTLIGAIHVEPEEVTAVLEALV